MSVNRHFQAS